MSSDRVRSEDGVALVFALLAVIVIGGMAAIMVVRASSQTEATRVERSHEQALHLAEAGLDDVIVELNVNDQHVTSVGGVDHVYDLGPAASEADQRAWAIDIAKNDCVLITLADGHEVCGIRPRDQDTAGDPLPWLYGVSFVDDGKGVATRVIKMQFDKGFLTPTKAILTNGSLNLGGGLSIGGANGTVHTNGDVSIDGNAFESTGAVTSTGDYSVNGNCTNCGAGSGQVDDELSVTPIAAIDAYRANVGEYRDDWYELCPDGSMRRPAFADDGAPRGPCWDTAATAQAQGRLLYDATAAGASSRWQGWSWSSSGGTVTWSAGGGTGNDVAGELTNGVYYVVEANVDISGQVNDQAVISVIVDAHGVNDPATGEDSTCTGSYDGGISGNIKITGVGGGNFVAFLGELLFLTDRDFKTTGNMTGTTLDGFIGAHEQLGIGGTPNVNGAVMAEDACPDKAGSPVSENSISGNFTLNYDGVGGVPLSSIVRITAWNELS